jgi:acyl-CoA ligase (AMP-forming) (exosortase A-associated)
MAELYLLHHLLEHTVAASPSKEAVVDLVGARRSFDYGSLYAMAANCAALLQELGVERRDRVAVYLPKSAEEAAAIFAPSYADGVVVTINALLLGQQVAHILADCGVKYLITSTAGWRRIREEAEKVESLRALLFVDAEDREAASESIPAVYGVMKAEAAGSKLRPACAIGEDLAAILYTSGSTGKPRGVMLSHRNLLAGSRIVSTYLEISSSERILSVVPFSFDYGLNQLLTSVQWGATVVLLQFKFPYEIVRALSREDITGFAGVPLIWAGLVHHASGLKDTVLPKLRYITNTGGMVPTATVKALRQLLPSTQIFLMYGLTEAFRSTYLPPGEVDRRPGSIGRAIPETEIVVINSEGKPCRPGEPGILIHRGPTVSLGYWGKPELTREVIRPHPYIPADQGGGMVCYSGDLVKTDEDGFIYFIARADGQIKSQGFRISPAEVEEVLMEGGELAQAAVIGLPAAEAGEHVHAVVVPATAGQLKTDEVLRRCARKLPSYMVPKSIEVVDALPKTPNGKIDYKLLRAERISRAQGATSS